MENQLVKIIDESGLDKTKAQVLLENFSNYFELAADWETKAKALTITSVDQRAEMKMAREGRLFLREKRIAVEKTRKVLKDGALREGQTIDAIAKILTNLIVPIEEDLENKEKYAEIQEANRKAALKADREMALQPFIEFVPYGIDFGSMDEDGFQKVLAGAKLQYQAKIDAEAKAEAERVAKEKAEAEERERIRVENERLRKEAEEKEKQLAAERAKAEADRKAAEDKARKEREAAERKLNEEREAARQAAEKAAAERAKLEAELRAKIEAEERARREANEKLIAEEKERIMAEKKAAGAPDGEKLLALASQIAAISLPQLNSDEAKKIVEDVRNLLSKVVVFINQKTEQI
jgi:hypothetical protein